MPDTAQPPPGQLTTPSPEHGWAELLADAIRALTAAARLTYPPHMGAAGVTEHPAWLPPGLRQQADWAEFVSLALAGAAANVGGIENALAGRPGSWEADGVRNMLCATVGHDEAHLLEHRTEPLIFEVDVDQILTDLGVWKAYDDAQAELFCWINRLDPRPPQSQLDVTAGEVDEEVDALYNLEGQLEQQRERDWTDYSSALTASITTAAGGLHGIRVPVVVQVADTPLADLGRRTFCAAAWQLLQAAIEATPLPGNKRQPMERLLSGIPARGPTAHRPGSDGFHPNLPAPTGHDDDGQ